MTTADKSFDLPREAGRLPVHVYGTTGPLVVLVHGWTLDSRMWAPQVAALSTRHRVVTFDRRGFGRATAPPDLDREPEDLLAILDALDAPTCGLVGMSQGGRVSLRFAHAHADRVQALVLHSAPLDGFRPATKPEEAIPVLRYREMVAAGQIAQMRADWAAHPIMSHDGGPLPDPLPAILADYDGRDLLAPSPAANRFDMAAVLAEIQPPSLVLTGSHDTRWLNLVADALAYGLPHAERVTIDGAGHMANLSHPEAYNRIVGGFLDRVL